MIEPEYVENGNAAYHQCISSDDYGNLPPFFQIDIGQRSPVIRNLLEVLEFDFLCNPLGIFVDMFMRDRNLCAT